ncbi:hypothetical protein PTKIN_Ptkin11bG0132400 [Pterospermum kingtungense]
MAGGSRGHRIESIGYLHLVSKNNGEKQITCSDYRVRQGRQSSFHQKTSRITYMDKQSGKHTRALNKQVVSTGETFKERSTGRVGYKNEYKTTFTYKVGDKHRYYEHQLEERIRSGGAAISYDGCNKYEDMSDRDGDGGEEYSCWEDSEDYDYGY